MRNRLKCTLQCNEVGGACPAHGWARRPLYCEKLATLPVCWALPKLGSAVCWPHCQFVGEASEPEQQLFVPHVHSCTISAWIFKCHWLGRYGVDVQPGHQLARSLEGEKSSLGATLNSTCCSEVFKSVKKASPFQVKALYRFNAVISAGCALQGSQNQSFWLVLHGPRVKAFRPLRSVDVSRCALLRVLNPSNFDITEKSAGILIRRYCLLPSNQVAVAAKFAGYKQQTH